MRSSRVAWYRWQIQGIPRFSVDDDVLLHPEITGREHKKEYIVAQYLESIEWMEKITGKKYDDELAIAAMERYFKAESLWGEIHLINGAVPAPIDVKSLFAMLPAHMLRKSEPCTLEFLEMLRELLV